MPPPQQKNGIENLTRIIDDYERMNLLAICWEYGRLI